MTCFILGLIDVESEIKAAVEAQLDHWSNCLSFLLPFKQAALRLSHDVPSAGHQRMDKTLEKLDKKDQRGTVC